MSVLADALRELRSGADTTTLARRLRIDDDLASALVDHWVAQGEVVATVSAVRAPASAPAAAPGEDSRSTTTAGGGSCPTCVPRRRWLAPLACHGCPFFEAR